MPLIDPERLMRLCLMAPRISLERAWHELQRNRPTPKATSMPSCRPYASAASGR
jgi:hypothetical protein